MSHSFYLGIDADKQAVESTDHVLLLGGMATSKTLSMKHSLVEDEQANILVIDLLGALYEETARHKQAQGFKVIFINGLEAIDLSLIKQLNGQKKVAIYIDAFSKREAQFGEEGKAANNIDHVLQLILTDQIQPLRVFIDHCVPLLYMPTLPRFLSLASQFQCQVIMSLYSTSDLLHYSSEEDGLLRGSFYTIALMGNIDPHSSVYAAGLVRGQDIDLRYIADGSNHSNMEHAVICKREPNKSFTAQWVTKEYGILTA